MEVYVVHFQKMILMEVILAELYQLLIYEKKSLNNYLIPLIKSYICETCLRYHLILHVYF